MGSALLSQHPAHAVVRDQAKLAEPDITVPIGSALDGGRTVPVDRPSEIEPMVGPRGQHTVAIPTLRPSVPTCWR
jgi:hypothetical protein